ncbi:MAG TPA: STAS domain-containing protein [Steroidobacteraceae bacterium]|jgi:phospholipid transport system transporter-binding protein
MAAEARQAGNVAISEPQPGRISVTGELTFANAREARLRGHQVFDASSAQVLVVDCSGVTRADSAGLAVLLDWLAWGRRKSRAISLENLPDSLLAIARISEVDGLLGATA